MRGGPSSLNAQPKKWPVRASANGRYLVDATNAPFFMIGDSAQGMICQLSIANATTYFTTRASQGFNTVLIELVSRQANASNSPQSALGDYPFLKDTTGATYAGHNANINADFSTANDAYFAYAASIVDLAATFGFLVVLYPIPWGFGADHAQGWYNDIADAVNTTANCTAFGKYLALGHGTFGGFAARPNLLWLHGSDYGNQSATPPSGASETKMVGLLDGLVAGGATQLTSGDWEAPSISTDETAFTSRMRTNGVYTYGGTWNGTGGNLPTDGSTYQEAQRGWNWAPAIPAYLKETFYEHSTLGTGSQGTPATLRNWHYYALLSGCTTGLLAGNEQIWPFASGTWTTAINDLSGSRDIPALAKIFKLFDWTLLVPSTLSGSPTLITAGGGTFGNLDWIAAAADPLGTVLVAYVATGSASTFTVDTGFIPGNLVGRWVDPTTGTTQATSGSPYVHAATRSFTIPGNNAAGDGDWILLLTPG